MTSAGNSALLLLLLESYWFRIKSITFTNFDKQRHTNLYYNYNYNFIYLSEKQDSLQKTGKPFAYEIWGVESF